jgi:hypothetical protein
LRRQWSLSGREGLESSLPLTELVRWDSGVFEELKRLFFHYAGSPEKKQRRTEVTEVTGR